MWPIFAIWAAIFVAASAQTAPEKVLAKHLIKKYDDLGVAGRPVVNINNPVAVQVSLNVNKIVKAEKNSITISAFLALSWNDPFLAWDPAAFSGAASVTLPHDTIWTPDIVFYSNELQGDEEGGESKMEDPLALVANDGNVVWVRQMFLTAPCVDDPQLPAQKTCTFKGGSWAHDSTKIAITVAKPAADFEWYEVSPTTELVSSTATVEDKGFQCCPGLKYGIFKYTLVVKKVTQCNSKDGTKCSKP